MQQQTCPACGTVIEPEARFCYACGTPISSTIVQKHRRRWLWLLWPLVLLVLVAGILWHHAAVYDTYVEGHCTITSVSSSISVGKYGSIRYTSLSYTVQSATGQSAETTRNYPDTYYDAYSVGISYPCWYNPADLNSADLDHHSGLFDPFSVWSMLFGFAYLFFAWFWNQTFSIIHFRLHARSTEAIVLGTERQDQGKVDIAFVTFTAQDGVSYHRKIEIDETLQPADVVPLWYDATNPAKGAYRVLIPWSWTIFIACISLLPLAAIVFLLYIGWTAF